MKYIAANDSSASDKAAADYVCTGVDDQAEIQDALDSSGKAILFAGGYNVRPNDGTANPLAAVYVKTGQILQGVDKDAVVIVCNDHSETTRAQYSAIRILEETSSTIKALTVDCELATGSDAISVEGGSGHLLEDLEIIDSEAHQINVYSTDNCILRRVNTATSETDPGGGPTPSHGVDLDYSTDTPTIPSTNITIEDSEFRGNDDALCDSTKIEHSSNVAYNRCAFSARVVMDNGAGDNVIVLEDVVFTDCYFDAEVVIAYRTGAISFVNCEFGKNAYITETTETGIVTATKCKFRRSVPYTGSVVANDCTYVEPVARWSN